ncbi:hypothetical protein CPB83DRAFT_801858 [Crepidotus variabilis]|uniref:EamA domain-containing protein n=1 Tax=Crepidotus variabilis TaxID=179855 RepID=A0A9P6JX46_9AGAR|nr:hypothetical protein CPB83DRAFT_801858 [Crepidotus variabilis]
MAPSNEVASIQIGGKLAVVIFIFTLLAFVVESELTQYVQTTLNYRQPYFLFYIVHSSFLITFPIHILYLRLTSSHSISSLLRGLAVAITNHLVPTQRKRASDHVYASTRFPYKKFFKLALGLTFGISTPAMLWFMSVSLSSMTDITAIWNTNAFFAYIISVKLFKLKWEPKRLLAVLLATIGTFMVVYGGAKASSALGDAVPSSSSPSTTTHSMSTSKPSAPLIGNLLTLIAAFGYGLYQVMYKIYAALPSDPDELVVEPSASVSRTRSGGGEYEHLSTNAEDIDAEEDAEQDESSSYPTPTPPPAPPFALYPNLLTSLLGLLTLLTLWLPLPLLHLSSLEIFHPPPSCTVWAGIAGIAGTGVVFNAGFMILLGVWGPVIVSVGNLLTIVGVLGVDIVFGPGLQALTVWSLVGSSGIVGAFGVLVWDMVYKKG